MPKQGEVPPPGIPPPEIEITIDLARHLVSSQHADLAGMDLRFFGSGWDNTTFRLGDDLAVRIPRRQLGAEMMVKEHRWLGELAPRLPLPIGAPVRRGAPDAEYPWLWSVVPWYKGVSAEREDMSPEETDKLAGFLAALHHDPPQDSPTSEYRGGPLTSRADSVERRIDRLSDDDVGVALDRVREIWRGAKEVPIDVDPSWLHGDLHPRNLIVNAGQLVAVIDWGDICVGDRATDLAAAWMLFPNDVQDRFRAAYGPISPATWERARGWAILFGVVLVDAGLQDDPQWAAAGARTLRRACS